MKKSLVILFAATIGLAACNTEKKGPGGLLYTIHKSEGKEKIKEGDIIKLNFIQKNEKDSIMANTYENEQPQVFPVGKKTYAGDMNDVLLLFGEGDSASFKINLDTMAFYSKQPKPEQFKNEKYLNFTVKIEKVFKKNANEADSVFQKRASDFFQADYKATMEKRKNAEEGILKQYISDNKLKTTTSASGLQYIIHNQGAEKAAATDTLLINYTGKLAKKGKDGKYKVFDSSDEKIAKEAKLPSMGRTYGPTKMLMTGVMPGFAEALQLIGKGGKMTAIIPSKIGYGEQGGGPIPPYSTLIFDIELTDIVKPITILPVAPATKGPVKK